MQPGSRGDLLGVVKKYTVCPKSSVPFYIVTYYIKWVTTSWTYNKGIFDLMFSFTFDRFPPL